MKMIAWALLAGLLACQPLAQAQTDYLQTETAAQREQRMAWWKEARFGMFIHWGLYAVPAGEYNGQALKAGQIGEWIMETAKIPIPEYEKFAAQFNPQQFDARQWAKIAKGAGMKYLVITSKHHDGFCLWDSQVTNYDIMDAAPFKRDILKELADACQAEGIKLCFYHSILDWHQPDAKSEKYPHQATASPNWATYREQYLKPQLAELIKRYNPAVLWFDGEWIPEWTEPQGKELYNYLRGLKPDLIINNRVGKGRNGMQGMSKEADAAGDFGTPEQEILAERSELPWETCMTMNDTWGFRKDDHNWKTAQTLVHQLIDASAKGGNYLLNVGPTAQGLIPAPSVERLAEMGKWMSVNSEAIYGTQSLKNYREGEHLRYTRKGGHVYAHLLQWPGNTFTIKQISVKKGSKIYLLGSPDPLKWQANADGSVAITLPEKLKALSPYAWVVKIEGQER
ncbi:MAG: alpha-L-fucosidase [Bernardetiaceae bacterium]|jgi:alpha-L-fucosidase|nr:alpha-L-fucosidase [Bernardetiaceae bacterium]